MKKLLFTLAIGLAILTSCESDLVSAPPSDSAEIAALTGNLVGSWKMTSLNYTGTSVTTVQGITTTADFVGEGSDFNFIQEFTQSPNNYSMIGSYDIELTTTVAGQTSVSNTDDLNGTSNGTWVQSGNILTFTNASNNNEVSDATIEILTNTTLKLTTSITKNISQQGVTAETTTNTVTVFEKL